MKQSAKVKISDIKEEKGIYIVAVEVDAEGYKFHKAYKIEPLTGPVDVLSFKERVKKDILEEVKHRKAMAPIQALADKDFIIEYGDTKTDDQSKSPKS